MIKCRASGDVADISFESIHTIRENMRCGRSAAAIIANRMFSTRPSAMNNPASPPAPGDDNLPFPRERYPYGSTQRYHLQHVHLFASDLDRTIAFYKKWFDAEVTWDGDYAQARNVFMKIGIGAIHLYDQLPRGLGKNAVHHLGMQVVGLEELYARMVREGVPIRNPIRSTGDSGYFMLEAPDGVMLEVFEPDPLRHPEVRSYLGYGVT